MSHLDDECLDVDGACPRCGAHKLCVRACDQIGCEDGWQDEHEYDPINFAPGEELTMCQECYGTDHVVWCSKCGFDITQHEYMKRHQAN